MYTKESFEAHLMFDHKEHPLQTYLREIVYGGIDGIVTTFAIVAGFTGANAVHAIPSTSIQIVLIFGLANLFGDGVSMALGNFLSVRTNQDVYQKKQKLERDRIQKSPDLEKEETRYLLKSKGFSAEHVETLTNILSKNPDYWVEFMMQYEHQTPNPESENPFLTGLATFFSFAAFGFIPLVAYLFLDAPRQAFLLSVLAAFVAISALGILRSRVSGIRLIQSLGETIFIGTLSAAVAYCVGVLF